ncbi:MAG TPA: YciI family protein [Caulobacter sp.]|nr:YciI family protein [Caulobacter sp.]
MKTFLALYMGSMSADAASPADLSEETIAEGMAAWGAWMARHAAVIVDTGGPLGKTLKAAKDGVTETRNAVAGYVIVKAESHADAAALFKGHPHFSIFPGESVEVMERLPIPGS